MKYLSSIFIIILITMPASWAEKIPVNIYVYHLKPPFISDVSEEQGIYYDFATYLNTKSERYTFKTIYIPKKRLEHMLVNHTFDGILLGVNPSWFNDVNEEKYLWSSNWFSDQDDIVSLKEYPIEYETPHSLVGKTIGGVRGFYYQGINELVAEEKIERVDTVGEFELLNMLILKRFDATIVSNSTFNYLIRHHELPEIFYRAAVPHDVYQRRVLIPKDKSDIYNFIEPLIVNLPTDQNWQNTLSDYYF